MTTTTTKCIRRGRRAMENKRNKNRVDDELAPGGDEDDDDQELDLHQVGGVGGVNCPDTGWCWWQLLGEEPPLGEGIRLKGRAREIEAG